MKIIDLLNKIANGEDIPKEIKYNNEEYKITKVLLEDNNWYFNYINEDMECIFPINTNHLNDEVEILEEKEIPKKINKLLYREDYATQNACVDDIIRQFNNLIDYLKSKGE